MIDREQCEESPHKAYPRCRHGVRSQSSASDVSIMDFIFSKTTRLGSTCADETG
jgi:hypothetical protein